jgi:signal transduction histidine kinase
MNLHATTERRDLFWNAAILVTAAATLLLNLAGLLSGITVVIPHLLYIPVVLAAYRYPRWGVILAACIGGVYLLLAGIITRFSLPVVLEALVRTCVLIIIGWLIAFLTQKLHEQEDLYRGLFDHAESGTVLISDTSGGRKIEAVNWKAASLLRRKTAELVGVSPALFWEEDEEKTFFARLGENGAVYAAETTFLLPDEEPFIVLVTAATLPGHRVILTFVDITSRVHAEHALQTANQKLNLLSRFSSDHLHRSVDLIIETVDEADQHCRDSGLCGYIDRIRVIAWNVARELFLAESYKDLGASPPVWLSPQRMLESARLPSDTGSVSIRLWIERLEIYADMLFSDVLIHLVENALRHGSTVKNITVTYHESPEGLDLIIEDDGVGIPDGKKKQIFEYDAGGHAGIGLFICRQIVEVTGMTIQEIGTGGNGARFVIHVPRGGYRIEGTSEEAPPLPLPTTPSRYGARHSTGVIVKELASAEFPLAEALWVDYHHTKGDTRTDRIFGAFHDREVVSVARCRRHPDGFEVDGVFTPVTERGHGYANAVMWGLIEACRWDVLYMHSVFNLTKFYGNYGFIPIEEKELPPTIKERYAWAQGEMEGANVCPMKRVPTPV